MEKLGIVGGEADGVINNIVFATRFSAVALQVT
jgi:hypothetical protein